MKRIIILGVHGAAGSYLVDYILREGQDCVTFMPDRERLDFARLSFATDMRHYLAETKPTHIFNFAALPASCSNPLEILRVNGTAVLEILEAILEVCPGVRFFQAGSASMFGPRNIRFHEHSVTAPADSYGAAKLLAFHVVRTYREKYSLHACTGIFFNAESPRRPANSFTRTVVREAVRIKRELTETGKCTPMTLQRLDFVRDWGWMPEYVEVAYRLLAEDWPRDFVIGTGCHSSAAEFVCASLKAAGVSVQEVHELGPYLTNPIYRGPLHVSVVDRGTTDCLIADPLSISTALGWQACYKMEDVARMMVEAEMKR